MKALLTLREAGTLLGLSHHTLRRWAKVGVLPVVRFGKRRIRVQPEELERFATKGLTPDRENR